MNLYHAMQNEQNRLLQKVDVLEKELQTLPEGTLCASKNGPYTKYYIKKNGERTYIPKREKQLIEDLAKKMFYTASKMDAQAEIKAINYYLKHHRCDLRAEQLLAKNDGIANILKPMFAPLQEKDQQWAEAPYLKNNRFPEALVHKGPFGNMFRSKTEATIAFLYTSHSIPYRYEWVQFVNGKEYAIDFTTKRPRDGRLIYWEHFGMMDSPSYVQNIGQKLLDFEAAGIFPGENLILTFESKQFPLDIAQMEEIISQWYCS